MKKVKYNERMAGDQQISMEEKIAARIYDDPSTECSESDAQELGRDILYAVLREFRPDLFTRSRRIK